MKTLEQLKKENETLRNQLEAKKELMEIQRKRNELLRENKRLLIEQKYGKALSTGRYIGKTSLKVGKKIGCGLWKIAKNLEKADRKEKKIKSKIHKKRKRKR